MGRTPDDRFLMRFYLFLILLCSMSSIAQKPDADYQLVWSDTFDYNGRPDPEKWNFETGFIRNLEKQYYTSRRKNCRVKEGKLFITARKERFKNKRFKEEAENWKRYTRFADYTSASINTRGKFNFQYGYVEVRAKLPKGKGIWPAIWMLGADYSSKIWPENGEIDIMEHVGKIPDEIHGTLHFPADNELGYLSKNEIVKIDPSVEFHIYGLKWDEEKIEFLLDNQVYHTFHLFEAGKEASLFRQQYYLILNLALGGKWAGDVDPDIFPQEFVIDYVKIYQKKNKKAGL